MIIDPISWEYALPYIAAALCGGYLAGSIPFGYMLTRASGIGDIRQMGSGNIGATNVLRTGRKWLAAATLVLDAAKGTLAVIIGLQYGPDIGVVAGFGAMIGHFFPVWLKFQGGKGVATAFGVMLALSWPVALAAMGTWIAIAAVTRYSSLAALIAATTAPVWAWYFATPQIKEFFILLAVLILTRHISNIRRLIAGEESRIGANKT